MDPLDHHRHLEAEADLPGLPHPAVEADPPDLLDLPEWAAAAKPPPDPRQKEK